MLKNERSARLFVIFWICFLFWICHPIQSLFAQYRTLESDYLRIVHYGQLYSHLVPYTAQCFENSLIFHRKLFDYTPSEKVTVFLHDFSDQGNAASGVTFKNHIVIDIAPYKYIYETTPSNERMNMNMNHELVHIATMDKASPSDNFFRTLFFGKVSASPDDPVSMLYSYLTVPRKYTPRWYREGIAVFLETWMSGGLGRAQGPYDEMVFRTMIRDSSRIYDLVGLESEGAQVDFQAGVLSYLYGTRFMSYLAFKYEPESLIEWTSRSKGSRRYFASQFKKVYSIPLDEAWSQWIQWEREFQRANLRSIRSHRTTPYHPVTEKALGSVSRVYFDSKNRKLYAAVNYPGQIPHIASIDMRTGELGKLCDVKNAALYYVTSLAFDEKGRRLFYTTDNNEWRDLRSVDLETGESKTLLKNARIGDVVFNRADSSIWGVRHSRGICTLVRIPPPYTAWKHVYSWHYGSDIYDIDLSPDGRLISASMIDITGKQKLILMEVEKILKGDAGFETLFDFGDFKTAPSNFVFSSDGRALFGSSYISGVSNIFRYDLEPRDISALSNCETGFFRPTPLSPDTLVVFRYTGEGFVPVKIANTIVDSVSAIRLLGLEIANKYPIVRKWMVDSPTSVNLDSLAVTSGRYRRFANIRVVSAYPVIEGYKDHAAYGMRLNLASPAGYHRINMTASYSPARHLPPRERLHLKLSYGYANWTFFYRQNYADFYDLFGPTKMSRKGYVLGMQYYKTLLYDLPKSMGYTVYAAGYGGLRRLPYYQNIYVTYDRLVNLTALFYYRNLRQSLGAVDYEKGVSLQILSSNNYVVSAKVFPRIYTQLDLGFPLPIHHSSIWLRSVLGYSIGERYEPFANFYFGGFGNNWIDYSTIQRYRRYYSFPGTELNSIAGTNFSRLMLEWCLPPLRFRRLGLPFFYFTWMRTSLFNSWIMTNIDHEQYQRSLYNIGAQVDFRIIMLSHLTATFSLGYAVALEREQTPAKEFMFSLKIL